MAVTATIEVPGVTSGLSGVLAFMSPRGTNAPVVGAVNRPCTEMLPDKPCHTRFTIEAVIAEVAWYDVALFYLDGWLGTWYVKMTPSNVVHYAHDTAPDLFATVEDAAAAEPGAFACTVRVLDPDTELAVADADAWVTSDTGGSIIVDGTYQTESDGDVTFMLDPGVTYYLWAQKDGRRAVRGQAFVAEADA